MSCVLALNRAACSEVVGSDMASAGPLLVPIGAFGRTRRAYTFVKTLQCLLSFYQTQEVEKDLEFQEAAEMVDFATR